MSGFLSQTLLVLERWLLPGVAVRRKAKRLQPCLIQGDDAVRAGDLAAARALYEERLSAARTSSGDDWTVGVLLLALGDVASRQHDEDQAHACFEESLALFRKVGSKRGVANALSGLGALAFRSTDLARAQALIEEAESLWNEREDTASR